MLSEKQLEALEDVRTFLGAMHLAQELVSGQRTPTLCHVLPIYATLIQSLKEIQEDCPKIKHGVQAAIDKLEEYMDKAKENQAYALAMSTSSSSALIFFSLISIFSRQSVHQVLVAQEARPGEGF